MQFSSLCFILKLKCCKHFHFLLETINHYGWPSVDTKTQRCTYINVSILLISPYVCFTWIPTCLASIVIEHRTIRLSLHCVALLPACMSCIPLCNFDHRHPSPPSSLLCFSSIPAILLPLDPVYTNHLFFFLRLTVWFNMSPDSNPPDFGIWSALNLLCCSSICSPLFWFALCCQFHVRYHPWYPSNHP